MVFLNDESTFTFPLKAILKTFYYFYIATQLTANYIATNLMNPLNGKRARY